MVNLRFIARQMTGAKRQCAVFILCVALSMITLVSLGSFRESVERSLLQDAQSLHAGDIIVRSHAALPPPVEKEIDALVRNGQAKSTRFWDFYSVVMKVKGEGSLLCNLKVVEPGYPFYGRVVLRSGRTLAEVLQPGGLVVEQQLLDRLRLRLGDPLKVGNATLVIRDVVLQEPDRPVNFFSLGPRVFVAAADREALGLIGLGSRVEHVTLLKLAHQGELDTVAARLAAVTDENRVRVATYKNSGSRVKRFFDNLLFFLNLSGIFTLLLSGFGIQSTLFALLKEQERTIAVLKALGAKSRFIIGHFLAVTLVLGAIGTLAGLTGSFLLQRFLPALFSGLIPAQVTLRISSGAIWEGMVIGLLVVLLFTALPLYRLKEVKPRAIFGKEEAARLWNRSTWIIAGLGALFFLSMVLVRLRDLKTGLYFMLALVGLILVSYLLSSLVLLLLRRSAPKNLAFRQALKGLFRPHNASLSIIVTLSAALGVIFSITLVEKNLDASFIESFPAGAPNVFLIDIQPDQKEGVAQLLGPGTTYYPIVKGTVSAVNDTPIDPEQERKSRGDNLGREMNLTYRNDLLPDERIVSGEALFNKRWGSTVQVSVLDTVLKMHDMKVGDSITFKIQGVPMTARIASIRTRTSSGFTPFFYFVFQPDALSGAPHTIFAAVRVDKERISSLQNQVVARFPNVSVIDLTETVVVFGRIMGKLSTIVRFFTSFSIVAGVLIVISSVFATRYARIQEAVYFTILGARRRFVLAVFAAENLVLGAVSGVIALLMSQVASLLICRKGLDMEYHPYPADSLLLVGVTTILVVLVGLGVTLPLLRQKPVNFLREQADE
ncbi:ABC transporter permease [Geomonas subterranea]|uniref:FtsX-like permease family protein n=1 Tax=Geomonas subterranea TaxID=2847989 RepID=A0ABX8LJA6_9BACT|nr:MULTISPECIES: FtsX-like permease family protein [Geomonas]QXE92017.1 FtsX-like permease family protein [Geomonas subterranea]QXM09890.1 FtsX-like permease family protein [Geomonas subterranea]